jgi:hypothetical protein
MYRFAWSDGFDHWRKRRMNKVIEIAEKEGRYYITPEDVEQAMNENSDDPHGIRIDVLEVLGKQTAFGAEDSGLCAFVAFKGPNARSEALPEAVASTEELDTGG